MFKEKRKYIDDRVFDDFYSFSVVAFSFQCGICMEEWRYGDMGRKKG